MLAAGTVIRVPVAFKNGEPKYLLVVDLDTEAHCLVMNSRIHPLFNGGIFRDSVVTVDVATHPFLHHTSHIDCSEVKRFSLVEIEAHINADATCLKGVLSHEMHAEVIQAMGRSPGLTPREKGRYMASLAAIGGAPP